MLPRAFERPLIFDPRPPNPFTTANRAALASAVHLPVIARSADRDLLLATRTQEECHSSSITDPGPLQFVGHGAVMSDGPERSIASITAMTRKAPDATPGLRLVAVPRPYITALWTLQKNGDVARPTRGHTSCGYRGSLAPGDVGDLGSLRDRW